MEKRKRVKNDHPYPDHWAVNTEYQAGKKSLTTATMFAVNDEPGGRFRFIRHVVNTVTGTEWIDCTGGTGQGINAVVMFRAFRPDRITKVFR